MQSEAFEAQGQEAAAWCRPADSSSYVLQPTGWSCGLTASTGHQLHTMPLPEQLAARWQVRCRQLDKGASLVMMHRAHRCCMCPGFRQRQPGQILLQSICELSTPTAGGGAAAADEPDWLRWGGRRAGQAAQERHRLQPPLGAATGVPSKSWGHSVLSCGLRGWQLAMHMHGGSAVRLSRCLPLPHAYSQVPAGRGISCWLPPGSAGCCVDFSMRRLQWVTECFERL